MTKSVALPNTSLAHCCSLARVASCGLLVALLSATANGQTTLNATYTSTPWDNTAALATGSGLTLNLGLVVEYLLVGGGGSGGGGHAGGGSGGGGVLTGSQPVTAGPFFIGIGTGGAASGGQGNNGTNTTAFSLTASGGGGGAGELSGATARSGGSGGGGSGSNLSANRAGASGTAGQGTNGGNGNPLPTLSYGVGGGGGGAATSGSDASSTQAGDGGAGQESTITGTSQYVGGGGGGGGWSAQGAAAGSGGIGGGGAGSAGTSVGVSGTANTGGGGGGSSAQGTPRTSGAGGSGIVIFRYQSGTRLASGGDENGTTGDWQYETVKSSKNVTLTYAAANLLATQSGAITGTGGLTYNSPGTLALTAATTPGVKYLTCVLCLAIVGAWHTKTLARCHPRPKKTFAVA